MTPIFQMLKDPMRPTEAELASLKLIAESKAYRVEYNRLETLINKGWCNAMGSSLTKLGKQMIE